MYWVLLFGSNPQIKIHVGDTVKLVSYVAFTTYVRKIRKSFQICCADSCLQWRSEPSSDLPVSNSRSKCCKECQLSVCLTVNASLILAPLSSVKKKKATFFNGIGTGYDLNIQIKIDLAEIFFFAVCCIRSYLYITLSKFTVLLYNTALTEEPNKNRNLVSFKVLVVWHTSRVCVLPQHVSVVRKSKCITPFMYLPLCSALFHAVRRSVTHLSAV